MPVSKQSKRKQPETEEIYDSCSDSENEFKKSFSSNRNSKKKKLISESESESDSSASQISENEDANSETSDEDKPIKKILEESKLKENSNKINLLSASSDDEPLATKSCSISSGSISNSSNKFEPEENGDEKHDDIPSNKMVKTSNMNGKSKKINVSSDSSDDEPLVNKTSSRHSGAINSPSIKSDSEENQNETYDDDDDVPITKNTKESKMNGKSNKINASSDSSDDEPLVTKTSSSPAGAVNNPSMKSEYKENPIETYDDDGDVSITKMNGKSKRISISSDSSDDEPLETKPTSRSSGEVNNPRTKSESKENLTETSDDEEVPISKVSEASNMNGKAKRVILSDDSSEDEPLAIKSTVKSKKQKNECSSSSDDDKPLNSVAETTTGGKTKQSKALNSDFEDEPLTAKKSTHHKSKKQKNGHASSDENVPLNKLQKPSNVKDKKVKSSSNDRIEHLKKYLRLSGIHIQSYDKLFADCKSLKAKTEKLLSILHEKGLKGRPTIEKCKKLRKKIETKREISELDISNIIHTEGRPKRGSGSSTQKIVNVQNSPAEKRFSRLKDIIDSEESD